MALTELNSPASAFDPARPTKSFHDNGFPREALTRLPLLHREAVRNLDRARLVARSPLACVVLMLTGALALLWADASGGGTLRCDFAWSALLLLGVVAMTRNYIRSFARSLHRVPLEEAAADLRMLLLYTGAVWGAGAFLVMPDLPAPALVFSFAAAPGLSMSLVLRNAKASLAFVAPASLGMAGAALLGAWPLAGPVAAAIITAGAMLVILPMLRRAMRPRICSEVLPEALLR